MKQIILLVLLTFFWYGAAAQINLIKNGGFEEYTHCPYNSDQIKLAKYWNCIDTGYISPGDSTLGDPLCAAEYVNTCIEGGDWGAPHSLYYNHYPRSGNGMANTRMYWDENHPEVITYYRDYTQGHLSSRLIAGQSYCVTFYVVMDNSSSFAINHIGAYLDDGSMDTTADCGLPQTSHIPQIVEDTIIKDSLNWVKVQGSFIANGTERFITIGNFYDSAHTAHIVMNYGYYAYYLLDDVSVIASNATAYAGPDVSVGTGDTAYIGVTENGDGMPCYWYVMGNATAIDSGGRIAVTPDTTTTYVVAMDLCGTITYDTVTVFDTGCVTPMASFTYGGVDAIHFTYTGTAVDSMHWNFDDGGVSDSTDPEHTYPPVNDSFNVCVNIYAHCGTDTYCQTVYSTACYAPVVAGFYYSIDTNILSFTFGSTGPVDSVHWYFGDGDSSYETNPVHVYSTVTDSYLVSIVIFSPCGMDTFKHEVYVPGTGCDTPISAFTYTGIDTVSFIYTGTGMTDSVRWNFGDGTAITAFDPIHIFTGVADSYLVCATMYGPCGTNSYCSEVHVIPTEDVGNVTNAQNVKVWPNPAHNELIIEHAPNSTVRICNIVGQEVQNAVMKMNEEHISISQLQNGTYLLQIIMSDGSKQSMTVVKE